MKKVLIVGLSKEIGGIETLFLGLFGDRNERLDLSFLYFCNNGAFENEFQKNGYDIFHMESRKSNPLKFNRNVAKFFKCHNFDYVWVNTASTSMYQFQYYAKKYSSAKVITHSHGTTFDATSGKLFYFFNRILGKINYRKVINNTDLFFCCSYAAGVALFGKENEKKLIMIKNGVSESRFKFSMKKRNEFRKSVNGKENEIIISFAGRLSEQKNPIRAIEIFSSFHKMYPNSRFVIAGTGKLYNDILKKIKEVELDNSIVVLGFYDKVDYLYCGSDVLLMPSLFEGLPLGGIEAQMTGLPCAFSNAITPELGITNLARFISLNTTDLEWANVLLELTKLAIGEDKRKMYCDKVINEGYNYASTLKQIESLLV